MKISHSLIALMMEAVQTCETLVNSYQSTRRYNPEDSHLQINQKLSLYAACLLKVLQEH
jgi:hypothetical protein